MEESHECHQPSSRRMVSVSVVCSRWRGPSLECGILECGTSVPPWLAAEPPFLDLGVGRPGTIKVAPPQGKAALRCRTPSDAGRAWLAKPKLLSVTITVGKPRSRFVGHRALSGNTVVHPPSLPLSSGPSWRCSMPDGRRIRVHSSSTEISHTKEC